MILIKRAWSAGSKALMLPLILLAVWHWTAMNGSVTPYLLPSPKAVFSALYSMAASGELLEHIQASLTRVFIGFSTTALIAVSIAMLFIRYPKVYPYFEFSFECIRVIPPLAFSPLFIIWMGIGEAPKLTIIFLASFFPIFLNTFNGLSQTDKKHLELAQSLELTASEVIRHIRLPAAIPQFITGLRLGFGYSWRALMGAELIAAASGLGFLIVDAEELARTDKAMAGIIVIAILGFLLDAIFKRVTKHAHG